MASGDGKQSASVKDVPNTIKGKFVLIAGGAKNLGGLIARDFGEHGATGIAIHFNSASSKADAEKPSTL